MITRADNHINSETGEHCSLTHKASHVAFISVIFLFMLSSLNHTWNFHGLSNQMIPTLFYSFAAVRWCLLRLQIFSNQIMPTSCTDLSNQMTATWFTDVFQADDEKFIYISAPRVVGHQIAWAHPHWHRAHSTEIPRWQIFLWLVF